MSSETHIIKSIDGMVDNERIEDCKAQQLDILKSLQRTQTTLANFNDFSEDKYNEIAIEFAQNTRMLKTMKGDLENIMTRINNLKTKISKKHPEVASVFDNRGDLEYLE